VSHGHKQRVHTSFDRRDLISIFLTGILLILIFPPFPFGLLSVVCLFPFFSFLNGKSVRQVLRGGYLIGFIWASGTLYWIGWATIPGLAGSLIYVPLQFAFFAVIQGWMYLRAGRRSLWAAPFLWTGMEYLFSAGPLGFPWNSLANTLTDFPIMIQYADITGMYGISFWIVLMNVCIYFLFMNRMRGVKSRRMAVAVFLLAVLPVIYGFRAKRILADVYHEEDQIQISMIQGNIDPFAVWTAAFKDSSFSVYRRLTRQVKKTSPDLIIWPESASPSYLRKRMMYFVRLSAEVTDIGSPLITGAPDYRWTDKGTAEIFNTAFLVQPGSSRLAYYHKMHLVPFSERVPFSENMPFLYALLDQLNWGVGHYSQGDSVTIFTVYPRHLRRDVPFGVAICFDSVFPFHVREYVRRGAEFLVIITNDGWFGNTSGPHQHAHHAVLRAIETRRWVARCANTGISEFVDPFGMIRSKTSYNKEAVLTGYIHLRGNSGTFFVKYGEWFVCFILTGYIISLLLVSLKKEK